MHSASTTAFTRRRAALLIGGYALGLGGMIYLKGLYLSEDRYFLILLVPAALLGLTRRYIIDFLPFIALMLGYEELRGVAHIIRPDPYYTPQIDIDKFLFNGTIPTVWLQGKLWSGHVEWWEKVLDVLLHLHFIVPPTILFLVWLWDRTRYYRFAITILVLSYAGAIGFALWPAAPPWMASQHHVIPHVTQIASRISSVQVGGAKVTSSGSWIVEHLSRNASAAVPSLHAAYSFTVVLMAFTISRKLGPIGDPVRDRDVVHDRVLRRALRVGRDHRRRARGGRVGRRRADRCPEPGSRGRSPRRSPRRAVRLRPSRAADDREDDARIELRRRAREVLQRQVPRERQVRRVDTQSERRHRMAHRPREVQGVGLPVRGARDAAGS